MHYVRVPPPLPLTTAIFRTFKKSTAPYKVHNMGLRYIKGNVRPDWICMRVVPLDISLKGHQPLYFLIFYFWSWIFDKSSKFWAASSKNESNLLLVRITVCIESCLPISWRTFLWWKNPPKCISNLVWIAKWCNSLLTSHNPNNNWYLSRIFGARFSEKDHGLSTCKPWTEQAGGLEAFLHEAAQNFEVFSKIQNQNKKIENI